MDGDAVLAAIRILKDRLGQAIYFSASADNDAGGSHLGRDGIDRVESYWERSCNEHAQWAAEYHQAIKSLVDQGFPVSDRWWQFGDNWEPQVCFSELPIERYSDGTPIGVIWVIGCGHNYEGKRTPDFVTMRAGDRLGSGDGDCEVVAGVMNTEIFDEWKDVYREIEAEERRLVSQRLAWQQNHDDTSTADDPNIPANGYTPAKLRQLLDMNSGTLRTHATNAGVETPSGPGRSNFLYSLEATETICLWIINNPTNDAFSERAAKLLAKIRSKSENTN